MTRQLIDRLYEIGIDCIHGYEEPMRRFLKGELLIVWNDGPTQVVLSKKLNRPLNAKRFKKLCTHG